MMRRLISLSLAVLLVVIAALVSKPIQAAPETVKHQMIASVVLKQGTNEAQVTLGVVDLGPSKKYGRGIFRRGVILADDAGRMIAIRGEAVQTGRARTYQVFEFTNIYIDMPGTRVIRVIHISLLVFNGSDWDHPYEDAVCSSPSLSIDACLAQWHPE